MANNVPVRPAPQLYKLNRNSKRRDKKSSPRRRSSSKTSRKRSRKLSRRRSSNKTSKRRRARLQRSRRGVSRVDSHRSRSQRLSRHKLESKMMNEGGVEPQLLPYAPGEVTNFYTLAKGMAQLVFLQFRYPRFRVACVLWMARYKFCF